MAKNTKTPGRSRCQVLTHDMERMADVVISMTGIEASPVKSTTAMFGPPGKVLLVDIAQGPNGTFRRKLPGGEWQSVGNSYGLSRQLARDISRAWGCKSLAPERGFSGVRRGRR